MSDRLQWRPEHHGAGFMHGDFRSHLAFVRIGSSRQEYAADGTRHGGELRHGHNNVAERIHRDRDCLGVRRGQWHGGGFDDDHGHRRREDRNG